MKQLLMAAVAWTAMLGSGMPAAPADRLAQEFAAPPPGARPWVYWFWLNGNLTRGGMTADLEAMKRAGIGGVLIMEVDQGAPVGPVAFMSDEWRELFKYMMAEAQRLGLEVNMNNDAGWNGSGGPWVPLDKAMQVIVSTETQVPAGHSFVGQLAQPKATEGFYRDIAVLAFPTPEDPANPVWRVQDLPTKGMSWGHMHAHSIAIAPPADIPAAHVIDRKRIVDLTAKMDATGTLTWQAPALADAPGGTGREWTIIRFGHTFTGAKSHPAPATGAGPECDKLSKEGIETHYRGMIAKLARDVGPLTGKTFTTTHVDSWEVGAQNWTPRMREEFQRLRGYDMLPLLPVLAGRIITSPDFSDRFLRDVRQTVSDLLAENYIGHLRTLANNDGLRLSMEAYSSPANDLDVANHVEEPICEFWWPEGGNFYWSVKAMASVAHVNARPVVGAEAFTSDRRESWLAHPAIFKALGDRAFCDGVNRFIVHRYAMQPWTDERWPGMSMGPWGLHYERSNTWWEDSKAWHLYVSRCQHLLRQGRFVADVLSLQSEEPLQRFTLLNVPGYDYDGISPQAFLKDVTVENGHLKLPSGMTYRVLVLPATRDMTPRMLDKIAALVEAGATVVGKPPSRAPGLTDYPQADARILEGVAKLWDPAAGRGRIVADQSPTEALAAMKVLPDFVANRPIRYIHRSLEDREIYFIANPHAVAAEALCTFRVSGMRPEAWFPDSGRIEAISVFEDAGGTTRIPLRFEPNGSMFVVFHHGKAAADPRIMSVKHDGRELIHLSESADALPLGATPSFTMAAWVKPAGPMALPPQASEGIAAEPLERNDVVYAPPGHEVWSKTEVGAGFSVGTNGVGVFEHGDFHFPAVLIHPAPITDWTHLAVIYQDGVPSLFLNGKLAQTGIKSGKTVRSGVGVSHGRRLKAFHGQVASLQQFPRALSPQEIAALARQRYSADLLAGSPYDLVRRIISRPGTYEIRRADGQTRRLDLTNLPRPVEISGPWHVAFAPGRGAPAQVVLDQLQSWSDHADPGVKCFSGSASYRKTFHFTPAAAASAAPGLQPMVILDLGQVAVMAEVTLNGRSLATLWKPPYQLDVTAALKAGPNQLEVRVVSLPINRMIGDELLPEDSERNPNGTLKQWPQWLHEGKPSPSGRFTFTSRRLWNKDSPLQQSGLLGPVILHHGARIESL